MSTMKTTVYLDEAAYRRLKALAAAEGRSAAELIRDALAAYTRARGEPPPPRSLGAGRSGTSDFSERAEEWLEGMGREG